MSGFFEKRGVRIVIDILAVVGVVAGIYHVWETVFAENKELRASHRISIVADGSDGFQISSFVRQDVADANRVIDLGVILWNPSRQIVFHDDIRGDDHSLTLKLDLDNSSYLVPDGWKVGKQNSSIQNNFSFRSLSSNTFSITWQAMDPNDFLEIHFLIATKLDRSQLKDITAKFNGSVTGTKGNVPVKVIPFNDIQATRQFLIPLGSFGTILLFIIFVTALPEQPPSFISTLRPRYRIIVGGGILVVVVGACAGTSFVFIGGLLHYLTSVPDWTSFSLASFMKETSYSL